MPRTYLRICCILILALASSACSGGSPAGDATAIPTATLTLFSLPPEATPTLSEGPGADPGAPVDPAFSPTPEVPGGSAPTFTPEAPGMSTFTPSGDATNPAPPVVLPSGPLCNDSLFVEDVSVPDGTILKPEEEFDKIWKFKNTGTCAWTTSYAIGFSHGNVMYGKTTKLTAPVSPGYTINVQIKLRAPKENGWYGSWWRLKSADGSYFGDFVFVSILVSDGTETATPVG
jgi:hypothetical protein